MKKITFFAFVFFITLSSVGSAQNYFGLTKLMEFAKTSKLSQFDNKIRSFGYLFEGSSKEDRFVGYTYSKKYDIGEYVNTNYIDFRDYGDEKPVIIFSSAISGYYSAIKGQIESNGFKETGLESEGNTLVLKYESAIYFLYLYTVSKEMDYTEETYNSIRVKIWKK